MNPSHHKLPTPCRPRPSEFGVPKAYGSYEEVLADPDIDAVYIPLPTAMHAEWAIKAAGAGKCGWTLGLRALKCCSDSTAPPPPTPPLSTPFGGAGKHILCEKPVAANAGEVRDIIAACTAAGVQFMDGACCGCGGWR